MTKKSRFHRKLQRARKSYKRLQEADVVYKRIFFAQLKVMHLAREYRKLHYQPLPKLTYRYQP